MMAAGGGREGSGGGTGMPSLGAAGAALELGWEEQWRQGGEVRLGGLALPPTL